MFILEIPLVYYYIRWRLKLEGETENICVCTKERKGVSAEVTKVKVCLSWKVM